MIAWARSINADYVHPCWERQAREPHRLLTPDLLVAIQTAGLGLILWHEERPEELAQLVRLPVDGIYTNTPDRLRDALRWLKSMANQKPRPI